MCFFLNRSWRAFMNSDQKSFEIREPTNIFINSTKLFYNFSSSYLQQELIYSLSHSLNDSFSYFSPLRNMNEKILKKIKKIKKFKLMNYLWLKQEILCTIVKAFFFCSLNLLSNYILKMKIYSLLVCNLNLIECF